MIRQVKKSFFNLIEISLAIAIIAIGISSIMVLFPVGMNATNDAVADNNIPDIADYMTSYLEAFTLDGWQHSDPAFINNFPDKTQSDSITEPAANGWRQVTDTNMSMPQNAAAARGFFKFDQNTVLPNGTTLSDFSAIIRVWRELPSISNPFVLQTPTDISDDTILGTIPDAISPVVSPDYTRGVVYCLEISYPAEKPKANRQTRLFRIELFNPY